jgi:hypothetical protein
MIKERAVQKDTTTLIYDHSLNFYTSNAKQDDQCGVSGTYWLQLI